MERETIRNLLHDIEQLLDNKPTNPGEDTPFNASPRNDLAAARAKLARLKRRLAMGVLAPYPEERAVFLRLVARLDQRGAGPWEGIMEAVKAHPCQPCCHFQGDTCFLFKRLEAPLGIECVGYVKRED